MNEWADYLAAVTAIVEHRSSKHKPKIWLLRSSPTPTGQPRRQCPRTRHSGYYVQWRLPAKLRKGSASKQLERCWWWNDCLSRSDREFAVAMRKPQGSTWEFLAFRFERMNIRRWMQSSTILWMGSTMNVTSWSTCATGTDTTTLMGMGRFGPWDEDRYGCLWYW